MVIADVNPRAVKHAQACRSRRPAHPARPAFAASSPAPVVRTSRPAAPCHDRQQGPPGDDDDDDGIGRAVKRADDGVVW